MAIPLVIGLAVFLAVPLSSPLPAPTPASAWFVYHVDSASERWAYDLAVDASGNPHIGAVECCNVDSLVARSLYAHWGYGAWSESTVIEYPDIYMFVEQPQVVVGPSGAVKIYESRHESLWNKSYLYETVPAPSQLRGWSMTPLDGPFDLIYDLKAASGPDALGLAYATCPEVLCVTTGGVSDVRFVERVNGAWSAPVVLASGLDQILDVAVAYDGDQPHVVYSFLGNPIENPPFVHHATRVNGAWETDIIDHPEGPVEWMRLHVKDGIVQLMERVFVISDYLPLRYVRIDGSGTHTEEVAGSVSGPLDFAVTTDGRPYVLYDRLGFAGLRLVHREPSGWTEDALPPELTDWVVPAPWRASMRLGADDNVRIAFTGPTGPGLWYASQVPLPTDVPVEPFRMEYPRVVPAAPSLPTVRRAHS